MNDISVPMFVVTICIVTVINFCAIPIHMWVGALFYRVWPESVRTWVEDDLNLTEKDIALTVAIALIIVLEVVELRTLFVPIYSWLVFK